MALLSQPGVNFIKVQFFVYYMIYFYFFKCWYTCASKVYCHNHISYIHILSNEWALQWNAEIGFWTVDFSSRAIQFGFRKCLKSERFCSDFGRLNDRLYTFGFRTFWLVYTVLYMKWSSLAIKVWILDVQTSLGCSNSPNVRYPNV